MLPSNPPNSRNGDWFSEPPDTEKKFPPYRWPEFLDAYRSGYVKDGSIEVIRDPNDGLVFQWITSENKLYRNHWESAPLLEQELFAAQVLREQRKQKQQQKHKGQTDENK